MSEEQTKKRYMACCKCRGTKFEICREVWKLVKVYECLRCKLQILIDRCYIIIILILLHVIYAILDPLGDDDF